MLYINLSPMIISALGNLQLIQPMPLFKPAEVNRTVAVRRGAVRATRESTEIRAVSERAEVRTLPESSEVPRVREAPSREVKLGRFVFTEEELAERQAAREGRQNAQTGNRVGFMQVPESEQSGPKKGHRQERAVSRAFLYRDKNAWNRNDINGDGTRWGSQHPRTLSLPFHPIVSD